MSKAHNQHRNSRFFSFFVQHLSYNVPSKQHVKFIQIHDSNQPWRSFKSLTLKHHHNGQRQRTTSARCAEPKRPCHVSGTLSESEFTWRCQVVAFLLVEGLLPNSWHENHQTLLALFIMKIRHIPSINKKKSVYICLHHCYSGYVITCVHSIHQLSLHQNVRGIKPNQPREKHLDPFHSGGILLICLAQQKLDILSVLWCHGHSAQRLWSFPKCIYIYTVYISTF